MSRKNDQQLVAQVRGVNREVARFLDVVARLSARQSDRGLRETAEQMYRNIHRDCLKYGIDDAQLRVDGLDEAGQGVVRDILWLGRNNFEVFNAQVLVHLRPVAVSRGPRRDRDAIASAFAEFIKSPAAHDLVFGGQEVARTGSGDLDAAITNLFNGLFGIEVTLGFARSVRVENLARILGYALSEQCARDMLELETDPLNQDPDRRARWLMARIDAVNHTFTYRSEYDDGMNQQVAACICAGGASAETTRAAWVADACIVDEARKTLILGGATAGMASDNQQAGQAVDKYLAATLLVAQKETGHPPRPNPFHGWQVESFQINLNPTAAERLAITGRGAGQHLLARLFPRGNATGSDVVALSQLGHLALFSEQSSCASVGKVLGCTDIHLIGCDTLRYHNRKARAVEEGGRAVAWVVLSTLEEAARVLARDDVALPLGRRGAAGLGVMLETLTGAVGNHFINFPAGGLDAISVRERTTLAALHGHFSVLLGKLDDRNPDSNFLRRRLRDLCDTLGDDGALDRTIRMDSELPDKHAVWNNHLYQRLAARTTEAAPVVAVRHRM